MLFSLIGPTTVTSLAKLWLVMHVVLILGIFMRTEKQAFKRMQRNEVTVNQCSLIKWSRLIQLY